MGSNVVVIDRDEAAFANLSTDFSGLRVAGDAAELAVLRQARIERADCLLAVTRHDNVNLMVAQVARSVFQVPGVMARLFDPSRQAVYREFEIETICLVASLPILSPLLLLPSPCLPSLVPDLAPVPVPALPGAGSHPSLPYVAAP